MSEDNLKAISELGGCDFFVPSYQRGYRWGEREVRALLEDIWDFASKEQDSSRGEFYCLQPVVVCDTQDDKSGQEVAKKSYRLIDGQQRLTTIFLILKFLGGDGDKDHFSLSYETREKSGEFLSHIRTKESANADNMDFYHFCRAYGAVGDFFSGEIDKEKFKTTLLRACKVLWYEIKKNDGEEERVFTRLNIGKIPLSPAENIKALFLAKGKDDSQVGESELRKRAEIWHESEKKAREWEDFRYAVLAQISPKDIVVSDEVEAKPRLKDDVMRIEVYLRAIASKRDERQGLFEYFYELYRDNKLDDEWKKLEQCISRLNSLTDKDKEDNREICHYLGFLTHLGVSVSELYKMYLDGGSEKIVGKKAFVNKLYERVQEKMGKNITNIKDLSFDNTAEKQKLKDLLLLFNIAERIEDKARYRFFEFNKFKLGEWELEHIYPQNSRDIFEDKKSSESEKEEWFKEVQAFLDEENSEDKKLIKRIGEVLEKKAFGDEANQLLHDIDENLKGSAHLNHIQNLALLDSKTNREIGNMMFSKKREKILELGDRLILNSTRKVFAGEYFKDKKTISVFSKKEQKKYFKAIEDGLNKFTSKEEKNNE